MNIYVASSWRNPWQPEVVQFLRDNGHDAYDFRNPETAYHWSHVDPDWQAWTPEQFKNAMQTSDLIRNGFQTDLSAMSEAQVCVLVLPCGRSAHLEAGWCAGQGKPVVVLIPEGADYEHETMYLLCSDIVTSLAELKSAL